MTTQMMRWKRPCSRPNRRKPPQCLRPKDERSRPTKLSDAGGPAEPDELRNRRIRENGRTGVNRINPMRRCQTRLFSREGDENDKPDGQRGRHGHGQHGRTAECANESRAANRKTTKNRHRNRQLHRNRRIRRNCRIVQAHRAPSAAGTARSHSPPESSPTFDGNPRLIRGYIVVEGYVMGDGTLVLDEAPFAVKHSRARHVGSRFTQAAPHMSFHAWAFLHATSRRTVKHSVKTFPQSKTDTCSRKSIIRALKNQRIR